MSLQPISPRVLELLASRICHDIISPVTAINNGVELVTELGASTGGDAMGLIGNSARQALDRLEFFRAAIGAGGADSLSDEQKLRKLADAYLSHGKAAIAWPSSGLPDGLLSRRGGGRALLALLAIAADAMPRGGQIELAGTGAGVLITARGEPSRLSPELVAALNGTADEASLESQTVMAHVAGVLARHDGLRLEVQSRESPTVIALTV